MSAALRVVETVDENTVAPSENKSDASAYGFQDAWELYPRKEARKDSLKAWGQVVTPADVVPIFTALVAWRKVWAARDSVKYVPLMASWLRGERWHDEIPTEFVASRHASHAPAKPHAEGERGEMPANVRDAIARIRGKAA